MNAQTGIAEDYWINYLHQAQPLHLPMVTTAGDRVGLRVEVPVPAAAMQKIWEAAGQKELNVLKLALGALGVVLKRYSGQQDITVAMPPMQLPGVQTSDYGTLYIRLAVEEETSVATYFNRLHDSVNNAYLHGEYDEALFRQQFAAANQGSLLALQGAAFRYTSLHAGGHSLQDHPLVFELSGNDEPCIRVIAAHSQWPEQMLVNMANSLLQVLLDLPSIRKGVLAECSVIPAAELQAWQQVFDNNKRNYPTDLTVIDKFLQQVADNPHKIALINGDNSLTYGDLEELSSRVSRYIAGLPASSSPRIIGVMIDRGYWLVAALVGILRAGAAYVPIDRDFPKERVKDILEDTGCSLVLTGSRDFQLELPNCAWLQVDEIPQVSSDPAVSLPSPSSLAYVLYSSGTTGKPKGIMMEHGAIMNLLCWYNERYAIHAGTRIVQLTNILIDIAFQEIFSALINGLTLYIPLPEESREKKSFIDFLNRHQINFIQLIPDLLSEYLSGERKIEYLEQVLCGGDKLNDSLKDEIVEAGYRLYNIYGQTETAIDTVGAVCKAGEPTQFNEFVPNYEVYIVDSHNHLCPAWVPGEIVTGGPGLARGYLHQPELTATKFVAHPFKKGEKVYRTGDMARRLPDGSINLLGREDDQVKILGFRVEPGEIGKALEACPGISCAVVTAVARGHEKQLAAYYITDTDIDTAALRALLIKKLPLYMIPHYFIRLDKMPLTTAGKLDRKALPVPEPEKAADYVAPSGPIEEKLVKIWAEALKMDEALIGIHSNFFELGGHSLKVVKVITAIEKEFNVRIQLTTFFTRPTIAGLEECILMDALSRQTTQTARKITI